MDYVAVKVIPVIDQVIGRTYDVTGGKLPAAVDLLKTAVLKILHDLRPGAFCRAHAQNVEKPVLYRIERRCDVDPAGYDRNAF